jgi:hypothetical protein
VELFSSAPAQGEKGQQYQGQRHHQPGIGHHPPARQQELEGLDGGSFHGNGYIRNTTIFNG